MPITNPFWDSFTRTNPDQFESLDYYRDGLRGLSLVLTSRGPPIPSINKRRENLEFAAWCMRRA